jgi:ketosteroid isomerase-like protein
MGTRPTTEAEADDYAREWIQAWNSHDVDRVAAHYRDDVEYESPFVARSSPGQTRFTGGDAVRAYIVSAFERFPDLLFTGPDLVALGAGSVTIVYGSVEGLTAAETLVMDDSGQVTRVYCHYRAGDAGAGP